MIPTYAASRLKLPASAFSIATATGTTTAAIAATWDVYISAENRAGLNQLSDPQSIALTAGQGLEVTINSDAIASGEDPFWIVVSIDKTGNSANAVRVAAWKVKDDDQITQRNLPATIQLTTDEHFNLTRTVADFASLPTTGMLDGAIAQTADDGSYWRYDSEAFADGSNYTSSGTIASGSNNWIRYYGTNATFIEDSRTFITVPGSDRPLDSIEYALTIPPKVNDDDSTPMLYWLNNGYEDDGQSPIVNGCYTFQIRINGVDCSGVYSEKIKYTLLGYVPRDTGVLDTSIATVGDEKTWTPTDLIKFPADLPRNHAAKLSVKLSYAIADIANKLPTTTPLIELNIVKAGSASGQLSPIANSLGNTVQADRGKLLINSGGIRQSGIATIKMPGTLGFLIDTDDEQPLVSLLAADTDNQVAAIAGSLKGLITIRAQNETLAYSERVRAIIGTATGISNLTVVSPVVAIANEGIRITVTHPINATGQGIVRANYDDRFLAGNEEGQFTPTKGGLILVIDGVIHQETTTHTVNATGVNPSQEFDITDLSNFTQIGALPTQDDDFILFEPSAIAVTSNGAGTINGDVEAYYYYSYETPNNKPTRIRHDIAEVEMSTLTLDLGESFEQIEEAVNHKNDTNNPHQTDYEATGAKPFIDANKTDIETNATNIASNLALINANTTAIANLPVIQAYSVATIAERDALTGVIEGSICKVADDGTGNPANYFYNDGAWEQYADLTGGEINNTYEVADIAARDALIGVVENDIAKVADDGTGNPKDYIYNGTAWLAFVGAASGGANNVYVVADIATRDALTGVIENDIAKVADDGNGVAKDYVYDGTTWLEFNSAVQTGAQIKAALEALVDPDKLLLGAINNARNITNAPVDDYCLAYDLASDSLVYRPRVAIPGAGAILLPLSQSLFKTADTVLTSYTPDVGTATFSSIKILTTAGTPDNQIVSEELVINVANTGAVIDLGVSDTVLNLDWEFNTGDNLAIICRYSADGSMVIVDLSGNAIATKTIVNDVVTTVDTAAFTFVDGSIYKVEVQIIGVQYKISIDSTVAIAESLINDFIAATNFGIGRLN